MMQRGAVPEKLIGGGLAQVAPPNSVGPLMVEGRILANSRSCRGAALEKTVPVPATVTVIAPKSTHVPMPPFPTHVPLPASVQQAYGSPAAVQSWLVVYGPVGPTPARLQPFPSLSWNSAVARS